MQAILIRKNEINRIKLPKVPVGSYWITSKDVNSKDNKLINIEGDGTKWQVNCGKYNSVIDSHNIKIEPERIIVLNQNNKETNKKVTIEEYGTYVLSIGTKEEIGILYCSPVYENNYQQVCINHSREITIGSDDGNNIVYKNDFVSDIHAKLTYNNGRWIIENCNKNVGTYVNGTPVRRDTRTLLNGDVIFIIGLKIIVMGNSLFINNPLNKVSYDKNVFSIKEKNEQTEDLQDEEENDNDIYADKDYYYKAPRIKNRIENETVKIDPPPAAQNKEEMPAILVLGSTLSMGAVMIVSMVNSIDGLANGSASSKGTIISLIVAFLTLVTMLLFPVLQVKWQKHQKIKYENKRQKRYKEYIDTKIKEIDDIMKKQKNILFQN